MTWLKDGKVMTFNNRKNLLLNGSLHIKHVRSSHDGRLSSDEGNYECIVTSQIGAVISRRAPVKVAGNLCLMYNKNY